MSKARGPTVVQDYDPAWARMGETACAEVLAALPQVVVAVEHIGSTAVPGLAAKPVIDLMAAGDLVAVMEHEATLERLGYQRHETGMPNRLFYRREQGGRRSHNLHIVPSETWPTRNERVLRDHLRSHPEDAARYATLKQQLASTGLSTEDYTRAKTQLIQEFTDRARTERGLPSVPVWEE